eukprot:TRINITY_DN635_c0_g1_i3.p1 TRINITY_DN635_c0_g1~~TRINITY_DN635_c0_g1_i3.p1  ORF type:complete len:577 (-),score=155.36 TRINITY_DN635_c0_g1_i3:677-2407(-)
MVEHDTAPARKRKLDNGQGLESADVYEGQPSNSQQKQESVEALAIIHKQLMRTTAKDQVDQFVDQLDDSGFTPEHRKQLLDLTAVVEFLAHSSKQATHRSNVQTEVSCEFALHPFVFSYSCSSICPQEDAFTCDIVAKLTVHKRPNNPEDVVEPIVLVDVDQCPSQGSTNVHFDAEALTQVASEVGFGCLAEENHLLPLSFLLCFVEGEDVASYSSLYLLDMLAEVESDSEQYATEQEAIASEEPSNSTQAEPEEQESGVGNEAASDFDPKYQPELSAQVEENPQAVFEPDATQNPVQTFESDASVPNQVSEYEAEERQGNDKAEYAPQENGLDEQASASLKQEVLEQSTDGESAPDNTKFEPPHDEDGLENNEEDDDHHQDDHEHAAADVGDASSAAHQGSQGAEPDEAETAAVVELEEVAQEVAHEVVEESIKEEVAVAANDSVYEAAGDHADPENETEEYDERQNEYEQEGDAEEYQDELQGSVFVQHIEQQQADGSTILGDTVVELEGEVMPLDPAEGEDQDYQEGFFESEGAEVDDTTPMAADEIGDSTGMEDEQYDDADYQMEATDGDME